MAAGRLLWAHHDSSGNLHDVAARAYAIAKTESWPSDPAEGNRLFRAWLVSQLATMANLGPRPVAIVQEQNRAYDVLASELGPGARYEVDVRPSQRVDNLEWQTAIATAICGLVGSANATPDDPKGIAFVRRFLPPDGKVIRIKTDDGAPPVVLSTVGDPSGGIVTTGQIGVVEGIVIVACVSAIAAAAGWITSQVAEVVSIGLQQHGKTSQAVAAMTAASEVLEQHQAEEQRQGRDLAYDAEQLELLKTLRETIKGTTGWVAPDLKSVPDIKGASQSIGAGLGVGQFFFGRCSGGPRSSTRKSDRLFEQHL